MPWMILSAVLFVAGLSIIVFLHELGHIAAAKALGVRVEVCSFGFGPTVFQHRVGDTYWRLSAIPFGGWNKLAGEVRIEATGDPQEFVSQPLWRRIIIGAMGSIANLFVAVSLATAVCLLAWEPVEATAVVKSKSAALAGIQVGDVIVAVNGVPVSFCQYLAGIFDTDAAQVTYLRGGRTLKLVLPPSRANAPRDSWAALSAAGVNLDRARQDRLSISEAIVWSVGFAKEFIAATFDFLGRVIRLKVSPRAVPGPIRFVQLAAEGVRGGFGAFLILMAMASLWMAIFNLLPIPILDGGVILMLIIEKLIGEIPDSLRAVVFRVGFACLMVIVTFFVYNDVGRLLPLR